MFVFIPDTGLTKGQKTMMMDDTKDMIKVFAMQLDMWAPPRDDVLIRYNLTDHFKEVGSVKVSFSLR